MTSFCNRLPSHPTAGLQGANKGVDVSPNLQNRWPHYGFSQALPREQTSFCRGQKKHQTIAFPLVSTHNMAAIPYGSAGNKEFHPIPTILGLAAKWLAFSHNFELLCQNLMAPLGLVETLWDSVTEFLGCWRSEYLGPFKPLFLYQLELVSLFDSGKTFSTGEMMIA